MTESRRVTTWTAVRSIERGTGFRARSLSDRVLRAPLDPFVALDDFEMSRPTFRPHPHAGFCAVTIMHEGSPGAFVSRDSLGDHSRIAPGDIHWTRAGAGVVHEEVPETEGVLCRGTQLFVNLARRYKEVRPAVFHVDAADVPAHESLDGSRCRVLAGTAFGVASPLDELLTPVNLLDVHLAMAGCLEPEVPEDHNAFLLVLEGTVEVGPAAAPTTLRAGSAARLEGPGAVIRLRSIHAAHVLLCSGAPLVEPVMSQGPFVMNDPAQIERAHLRFAAGRMGKLEPSF